MAYRFDGEDIVIDGWQDGIAPDPYSGFADMRNVNISGVPQEVSVNFKTVATNFASSSGTITLTDSGDTVAFSSGSNVFNGVVVTVGASVGGLTAGIPYYVIGSGPFQLSLSYGGSAVAITTNTSTTYATVDMGLPVSRNSYTAVTSGSIQTSYFILDKNGRAWVSGNGILGSSSYWTYMNNTTLTNASGQGIVAWRGYLFVFRNAVIDIVSLATAPLSGGWTYAWKTLNSNNTQYSGSHQALVGQNDFIYYCDVSVVGSINKVAAATFDPTDSATYSYNSLALQLPSIDVAICLGELGVNLLIGGLKNFIYPWNRIPPSSGTTGYSYPIQVPEQGTYIIVPANNVCYCFCGNRGRIYATNGSSIQEWGKIPDHLVSSNKPYYYWKDAAWTRNKIWFSFSASTNMSTTPLTTLGGIWSIDTSSKAIQLENQLSYATYAGFASLIIPQILAPNQGGISANGVPGEAFYVGWYDGVSSYGVDAFANAADSLPHPYSSYEAYIDSEKIPVGQFLKQKTFSNIEFKLGVPLTTSEKIKILYRVGLDNAESPVDATAGYTQIGETTYAANTISAVYPVNFQNAQWVQFRIRLSSSGSGTSESFVKLREIRLRS